MPSRHADIMDAAAYWRGFPVTAHFNEPCEIVGTVLELGEHRTRDEIIPKLRIQQADGIVVIVIAGPTRLQYELVKNAPAVGDKIRIVYTGESSRAAPGMNPTKEFTVAVKRQGSQPGAGTEGTTGSATPENEPRTGSKGT